MQIFKDKKFDLRMNMAAEAKRKMLEQVRKKSAESKEGLAERQESLRIASSEQSKRSAQVKISRKAAEDRKAAIQELANAEHAEALKLEKAESDRKKLAAAQALAVENEVGKRATAEKIAKDLIEHGEKKEARDARYAARKARQR